jgi:poly-beta-1,6-N-acetyl-D-glucosamine synthase
LRNQSYPKALLEIIFIDDHSVDQSYEKIAETIQGHNQFKVFTLPNGETGKKRAIRKGILEARDNLIITTDADCSFPPHWISEMVGYSHQYPGHLLIGPVFLKEEKGFLNHFQSTEFLSLIASGAGAAGLGRPILCNGANLGGDKELFHKAMDIYDAPFASGDDIFLLLKLKSLNIPAIFVKSPGAAVITANQNSLGGFVEQRTRWTFKSRFYRDFDIISTAIIVLFTNIMMLGGLFLVPFFPAYLDDYLLVYLLKCLVDYVLLYYVAKFFGRENLLRYFLVQQLLYIVYVSVVGTFGHLKRSRWKT